MSLLEIKNLSFTYPNRTVCALNQINFSLTDGEFVVICGKSGCGKSTLLKQMKSALTPHGTCTGEVLLKGKPLLSVDLKEQATKIGYVLQNPENQIVTDKVWHELAFGLESIGTNTQAIRLRVAEMASFFGIEAWFHKNTNELSGGQKQLLNLASVMAMQPEVLLLDEPTSQLDPIAASEFLQTLKKINSELGIAVILSEQRLEEVFPLADRVLVMEKGSILFDDCPQKVGNLITEKHSDLFEALPAPIQIHTAVSNALPCPLTVKDGRQWLNTFMSGKTLTQQFVQEKKSALHAEPIIKVKDLWFRYEKDSPDVIQNLSFEVQKGELFCLLGGNGSGKTTALSLLGGIHRPQHGKIEILGKNIGKYSSVELYKNLALLPQDPQSLFVMNTVRLDLQEVLLEDNITNNNKNEVNQRNCDDLLHEISELIQIESLLDYHPYDLSGGEQQRAALAKVLLTKPQILLLDEPTKGIDSSFKLILSKILKNLTQNGVTIIMVSHDIEFCAKYADRCALFFDGSIVTSNRTTQFFSGNSFYTTAANRMARHIFPNAVTNEDVISLCKQAKINPKK